MRIVHFSDTWLPRRDGVIASIYTLSRGLTPLGHDSLVVAPHHPDATEDPDLPVHRLRSLPSGVANLRFAVPPRKRHVDDVRVLAPDVIHVHTPGPAGLLGIFAARTLGIPLVQTYHTDLHAYIEAYRIPVEAMWAVKEMVRRRLGEERGADRSWAEQDTRGARRVAHRAAHLDTINQMQLGRADAVIVPTRAVLDRIRIPLPRSSVHVVPTGVAPRPVDPGTIRSFRTRHGLLDDRPTVLFVGRVNQEKGVELLLPAFAEVRRALPRARLVLVGALYDRSWYDKLVTAAGLHDAEEAGDVVLCGQLPPEEVAAAYASAHVFAFPSLTDTQGLVLQESALAGLPAVLCDAGLHQHGPLRGAAALVEPTADALARGLLGLLEDPVRAARLGAAAHDAARLHTPDRYAAAVLDVYRSVCAVDRRRVLVAA